MGAKLIKVLRGYPFWDCYRIRMSTEDVPKKCRGRFHSPSAGLPVTKLCDQTFEYVCISAMHLDLSGVRFSLETEEYFRLVEVCHRWQGLGM
jgi:hypothetical protein